MADKSFSVTANGDPVIMEDGANNTLEYWGAWNVYGTGNMNLTHVTLTGIQLDTMQPQGLILINNGAATTSSSAVTLTVTATDAISGVTQIRFSNDNATWDQSQWVPYANDLNWQLTSGDGAKTVYCQIKDSAGLITTVNSSIILSTQLSTQTLSPSISTPTPTQTPSQTSTTLRTASPTAQPTPIAIVPELSIQMFIVMTTLGTLLIAVACKRKHL